MKIKDLPENCHCGKPMHLSTAQKMVIKEFGKEWDTHKVVKLSFGKSYKVPTYYILLHGIKYTTLPDLGFEELPEA